MIINTKIIKIVGDALIPLLGYFGWNWSLYFIFLYYMLDLISREVVVHVKARKIATNTSGNIHSNINSVFLSISLLVLIFVLMHLTAFHTNSKIDFISEVFSFLSYSDMGIPQGYVLVPLVVLASFASYKTEFLLPKVFSKLKLNDLWKTHIQHSFLLVLLGLIVTLSSIFLANYSWLLFLIIIGSITGYQLIQYRNKVA